MCIQNDSYQSSIVFEGDSIQAGSTVTASDVHTYKLRGLLKNWSVANLAVGGSTTTSMSTAARTTPAVAFASTSSTKTLVVWVGTNDLNFTIDSAATIMSRITSYTNDMKSAGFNKVLALTVLPVNPAAASLSGAVGTPTHEVRRQQLNDLIKAQQGALFTQVLDIGSHPVLGQVTNTTNTTWYSDGVHITPAGYDLLVEALRPVLTAL